MSALSAKAAFIWEIAQCGIPRTTRKLRISIANQRYRAGDPLVRLLGSTTQNAGLSSEERACSATDVLRCGAWATLPTSPSSPRPQGDRAEHLALENRSRGRQRVRGGAARREKKGAVRSACCAAGWRLRRSATGACSAGSIAMGISDRRSPIERRPRLPAVPPLPDWGATSPAIFCAPSSPWAVARTRLLLSRDRALRAPEKTCRIASASAGSCPLGREPRAKPKTEEEARSDAPAQPRP